MNLRNRFDFHAPPEIVFGVGVSKEAGIKAKQLGATRVMLIADKALADTPGLRAVEEAIKEAGLPVGVFAEIAAEPTIASVTAAVDFCKQGSYDGIVAVGGGSSMDTGKAVGVVLTHGGTIEDYIAPISTKITKAILPLVAIPTTAGTGSEVTSYAVVANEKRELKTGMFGYEQIRPRVSLCDPQMTVTLPPRMTAGTGMDALTHAVEAYTNNVHHPMADIFNLEAIRQIGKSLRTAVGNPNDIDARAGMLYGSMLAGIGFSQEGTGDVHALAGPLASLFHVPHGLACGILLPYIMEYNMIACLERTRDVAVALGENVEGLSLREAAALAPEAVFQLMRDIGVPLTLDAFGVTKEDVPRFAAQGYFRSGHLANARLLSQKDMEVILYRMF